MSRRILVTLPDDPTLAAQAHAAIVAVPGVVCVVAVPGYAEDAVLDAVHEAEVGAGPARRDYGAHAGLGLTTGRALDMLDRLGVRCAEPAHGAYTIGIDHGNEPDRSAVVCWQAPLRAMTWLRGEVESGRVVLPPSSPTYTVGDEEDGEP